MLKETKSLLLVFFFSILLRNKELASKSNLTGDPNDVISFLQDHFKEYYASIIQKGDKILSLFEKDRDLFVVIYINLNRYV